MKKSKMTLKTQYKTAGAFYATGTAIIMLSELKTKQGHYVFMPHGRENIKKVGGTIFLAGNVLHILGNLRVATRVVCWASKKVFGK